MTVDHVDCSGYCGWWCRKDWVYFEVFELFGGRHVRNGDLRRVHIKIKGAGYG